MATIKDKISTISACLILSSPSLLWAQSWSPLGDAILHLETEGEIALVWVDKSIPDFKIEGHCGEWSPSGDKIAFLRSTDQPSASGELNTDELFLINPDGTGEQSIAQGVYGCARWSPDGDRLAYPIQVDSTGLGVVVSIKRDGSDYREEWAQEYGHIHVVQWIDPGIIISQFYPGTTGYYRTNFYLVVPGSSTYPNDLRAQGDYSPANGLMVFSTTQLDEGERVQSPQPGIYTIDPISGDMVRVHSDPCSNPSWSPDGKALIFTCYGELFILELEGNMLIGLDVGKGFTLPKWSPTGDKICVWWNYLENRELRIYDIEALAGGGWKIPTAVQNLPWGEIKKIYKN